MYNYRRIDWSALVIGLCALGGHAVNLIPFSYGILQVYIYSYLYQRDDQITKAQMHMHAPVVLGIATGTAWTFGIFVKVIHPIILHVFNGLALCGWMLVLYFYTGNYVMITVSMACVGFHLGQLHIFFSQRVTEEGKARPSAANGFYGFWFGIAGIWGNLLGYLYFNPKNLPKTAFVDADGKNGSLFQQEEIINRVPYLWLILCGVLFVCFLPGYFIIGVTRKGRPPSIRMRTRPLSRKLQRNRSKSVISRVVEDTYGLELDGEEEDDEAAPVKGGVRKLPLTGVQSHQSHQEELKPVQKAAAQKKSSADISIFSGVGVVLFSSTVGIGISSLCAFELFKEFGTSADSDQSDDSFYNLAGIIIPIVGAGGRVIWGVLGDKVSYKILFLAGNVATVILQVSMAPGRVHNYLYVSIVSVLAVMPGMMTLLPPAIKHFMGTKDIGLKFGIVLTGEVFGCGYYLIFASVVRRYLSDLVLMVVLSVPSALAILPTLVFLRREQEREPVVIENRTYRATLSTNK